MTASKAHEGGGAVRENASTTEKWGKILAEQLTRCKWRFDHDDEQEPLD